MVFFLGLATKNGIFVFILHAIFREDNATEELAELSLEPKEDATETNGQSTDGSTHLKSKKKDKVLSECIIKPFQQHTLW
jgi:hypothetical protein